MSDMLTPLDPDTGDTLLEIDRRMLERYPCNRRPAVRVLARPSFQPHHAVVRDISIRSIGLILDRPLEIGTILAIQLRTKHVGFSGILSARVEHSTQMADGTWHLGCTLARSLTDDEVFSLL